MGISPVQIIIVLGIILLVFGAKRLPEMGRSLGRSMREFKGAVSGDEAPTARDTAATDANQIAVLQAPPAPTPEIAEAELVDARRAAFNASGRGDGPSLN